MHNIADDMKIYEKGDYLRVKRNEQYGTGRG